MYIIHIWDHMCILFRNNLWQELNYPGQSQQSDFQLLTCQTYLHVLLSGWSCGMLHVQSGPMFGSTEKGCLLRNTCELCWMFYVSRSFFPFSFPEYICSLEVSCRWSFHWWQFNLKHLSCLWGITCSCFRPWKKAGDAETDRLGN